MFDAQFNRTCLDFRVDRLIVAPMCYPFYEKDGLVAHALGQQKGVSVRVLGVKHHLKRAFPIDKIDKDHAAHVTFRLNPA